MRPSHKPDWLKAKLPEGERYNSIRRIVHSCGLNTVCKEAMCPNMGECWNQGSVAFMILGDICTRGCRFCAVARNSRGKDMDPEEPNRIAEAVNRMNLDYAVVTSVTRDDLPDGGASQFAKTVRYIKKLSPPPLVELLIPDFSNEQLDEIISAGPDVIAHNIEVVERLTGILRNHKFSYRRSLDTLRQSKLKAPEIPTKSSLMLGLGETQSEIESAMSDLRQVGVEIIVIGQYLRPTKRHAEIVDYIEPFRFDELARLGNEMGFSFVAASPLARTSYKAAEAYVKRKNSQE